MVTDTRVSQPDVIAAELEGLIALDHRNDLAVIKRAERFKALQEQSSALDAQKRALRDEILKDITDRGAQGLMVDGAVIVRRSEVTQTSIDSKALRDRHPRIYAAFVRQTKSIRLTVGK